jgi:Na+/melibiose symporter-like transporter
MSNENKEFNMGDWEIASTKKMVSYSFGFIISLYLLNAYNYAIFYFYEVEIGLKVELVTIAIMIYAIWDMSSSPLLGYFTDRPFKWSVKWGFRAPWIILAAIPALVFYFFLYTPPDVDIKSNFWIIFFYLLINSCLFAMFLSLFRVHFEGSFANHFREDFERRKASAINFIFPGIILFVLSLLPPALIVYGKKSTFVLIAILSVIIMGICLLFLIPGIVETKEIKRRYLQGYEEKRYSFFKMLKIAFGHKNYKISLLSFTLANIAAALGLASGIYFFKDVLKLPLYYAIFSTIAYFLGIMLAVPIWVWFSGKYGNLKTYAFGTFLSGLFYLPFLWLTTLIEAIIFSFFQGIAYSSFLIMLLPIASDCYDEITLSCEKHQEATLIGISNIFNRSVIIFQALIIGIIHIITGYNQFPNAVQTPLAIWGVRFHRALIPAILCFSSSILMWLWYDLKGDKKLSLKVRLREKGL